MIETQAASHEKYKPLPSTADAAFLIESANVFARALHKIEHCLKQLNDDHVNWRPFEAQNSIANIILHLCGNLRQWVINGLPAHADDRNRAAEFSDRDRYTRDELVDKLRATIAQVREVLTSFPADQVLSARTIQGFKTTVLQAVYDTTSHFVGHTHQIVWITRFQLRDAYMFDFVPTESVAGK